MQSEKGFTLIELSFVLIIFGMVLTAVMTGFALYNKQAIITRTDEALRDSNSGLLEYVANFGVYPCPADPALGPDDINYGREQRAGGLTYADPGYDIAACLFPVAAVDGEDSPDPGTANDGVLIGAIPAVTIQERLLATETMYANFSDYDSIDGWGHKLTYAVTASMTNRDTYNNFYGAINVVDENDLSLLDEKEDENDNGVIDAGEDVNGNGQLDFGQYAHFALVSHGDNGRGARMRDGTEVEDDCGSAVPIPNPAPPGTSAVRETENCDYNDGKFLSGLRNENDLSYNDDKVKFSFYENAALWRYVGQGKIENTNPGNVGIGTNNPQQMLHVLGEVTANRTRARLYTDRTGSSPVPAEAIGGDATTADSQRMQCDPGQVVTRIEGIDLDADGDNDRPRVVCGTPYSTTPPDDVVCPVVSGTQHVMRGMINGGSGETCIICCDPLASPCTPTTVCP